MLEHEHGGVDVIIAAPHLGSIECRDDSIYSEVYHRLSPRAILLQAMTAFFYNLYISQ
jgi:hypothetical protein